MIGVLFLGLSLFPASSLSAPIFSKLLRPLYPFISHSTHSNIRVNPVKTQHHHQDEYKPVQDSYDQPPHDVYAHAPVLETYKPIAPEAASPPSYAPSTVKYQPAPSQPSEVQGSDLSFENFDVSVTNEEPEISNEDSDQAVATEPQAPASTSKAVTQRIFPEIITSEAPPPPPTTTIPPVTIGSFAPPSVSDVIDLKEAVVLDDGLTTDDDSSQSDQEDISDIPLEMVLEMAKDPKADKLIIEMAVEKIKDVQELNKNDKDNDFLRFNAPDTFVKAMPTEILLEMAKDADAGGNILEVAKERLEEELKEKNIETHIKPNIQANISEMPLEIILEMAKAPEAEEPVLEMAIDMIEEAIEIKEINPDLNTSLNEVKDDLAEAMPMKILLEMAKDPKASEPILEIVKERLKEHQELIAGGDGEGIEEQDHIDTSDIPLKVILEAAKYPKAEEPVLQMAVEKIQEVLDSNHNKPESEKSLNVTTDELAEAIPMEILLDMAKDPNVSEPILEIAMDRLKELKEDQHETQKNISDMPLELILEMAKDKEAENPILEMAIGKIEAALEIKDNIPDIDPSLNDIEDDLAEAMPMEIILEMAKDPNASGPILEIAMEKLEELQDHNVETDVKDTKPEDYIDTSLIQLEVILDEAKDPKVEEPVLEMAVEKIKEVLKLKHDNPERINDVEDQLAKAIPMEILLEMAKDPEVSEPILEITKDRLKELQDDNTQNEKEDIGSKNTSQIQLEVILDMAKDPEAGEPILEMAMSKIKDVLEEKEDESISNQVSNDAQNNLPKVLPMQILLEMAKDPEAKEHILKLAMARLKELQELNIESEMELVKLEPKLVEGEHFTNTEKNPEEPVILQFPRFF